MNNEIIYIVGSDIETSSFYAEFDNEAKAIDFAKENLDKLPFVQKVVTEYDDFGNETFTDYIDIWDHTMVEDTNTVSEEDVWDTMVAAYEEEEKNKYDLGDTTWFESVDTNDLVEAMEENEDMVECKECFELFPKADCIKLDIGYICPTCADAGKLITVSDEDTFKVDFPEYDKFQDTTDIFSEEEPVSVEDPVEPAGEAALTPEEAVPFLVKDEEEAVAGYEEAAKVVADSDLENKEEILDTIDHIKEEEVEHIEELTKLVDVEEADIPENENDPISNNQEDKQLNELFGFGKKKEKRNRYLLGIFRDTSGRIFTGDLIREIESILRHKVPDVKRSNRNYFAAYTLDQFEFTATETEFSRVKFEVEHLVRFLPVRYFAGGDTMNYRGELNPDIKQSTSRLIRFECIEHDIKESLAEEDAELIEHINEEHPAIESDQELQGIDNAVVDCKVAKVITHSEDEKPLNCEMKNKPLEKPLTEAINYNFTEEEMKDFNMDEDGVSLDSYDEYVRCNWCDEVFAKSDCEFEANLGWLCDRCYEAITSRGEKLTIIKNPSDEDIAKTLTEEVKMTAKELKDKFGTDDVELINAGREPEERVELEEAKITMSKAEMAKLDKEVEEATAEVAKYKIPMKVQVTSADTTENVPDFEAVPEDQREAAKKAYDRYAKALAARPDRAKNEITYFEEAVEEDEVELTSDPAEKPSKNVKIADTSSTSGMDFEEACKKFDIEIEE